MVDDYNTKIASSVQLSSCGVEKFRFSISDIVLILRLKFLVCEWAIGSVGVLLVYVVALGGQPLLELEKVYFRVFIFV